jgi:hypothetical protein
VLAVSGAWARDSAGEPGRSAGGKNPLKNVYFGEQHMHTRNSFDAFTVGVNQTSDILTSDEHNFIEAPTSRPYNC